MKNRVLFVVLILFVSIFFVGCNSEPINLEGSSWKLESYVNNLGHSVSPVSNTKMNLEFKDGRISGSSGCNSYFAKYTLEGKSLTFGLIGATKMHCTNPAVMEQETTFLSSLALIKTFKVEGNKLKLIDGNGKVLLTFNKA